MRSIAADSTHVVAETKQQAWCCGRASRGAIGALASKSSFYFLEAYPVAFPTSILPGLMARSFAQIIGR
jgi:hypothetical protein